MTPIATYVFMDLETTGIPKFENNKTRITELSMIAVKRRHVLDTRAGASPRVQHKLTLCLNPRRMVHPQCSEVTGLCNDLLEHETTFNMKVYTMITTFLDLLTKPVCLIAQNGHGFDFPILKKHFEVLNVSLPDDVLCADSYHAFYDILEGRKKCLNETVGESSCDTTDDSAANATKLPSTAVERILINETTPKVSTVHGQPEMPIEASCDATKLPSTVEEMKLKNETTPKRSTVQEQPGTPMKAGVTVMRGSKTRRRFPFSLGNKPKDSYKLGHVYERLLNRPAANTHHAEGDCVLMMECSVAIGKDFCEWVDQNSQSFSEVRAMTPGVPVGD
ncbi:uncharacterized protein LOC119691652 [Plutella xylostella]|uniref:uncharacterized protein LOC119691652 n=1 Tax=Plutella xylostella TaxID=51655 RepID=UPI002032CE50|nr:uncharacterized protein LOC119691652 [Plutella xylostella]